MNRCMDLKKFFVIVLVLFLVFINVNKAVGQEVEVKSFSQKIDESVQPVVDVLGKVLFWDLFEAIGIYDPVVYTDQVAVLADVHESQWNNVTFVNWIVESGTDLQVGDAVAIVSVNGQEIEAFATQAGILSTQSKPGDQLKNNKQMLGKINLTQKVALLDAKGKPIKKPIPIVVVWLVIGAIFFTIKMRFINFKGFKHAIDLVAGKYSNPNDKGEVSHFQALATALSATVGLGNIAGVAVAITLGGAGATFWMILAGLLGMSSKFVECTLGVKYRQIDENGNVSGGPMY